jgi:hypothetical protein
MELSWRAALMHDGCTKDVIALPMMNAAEVEREEVSVISSLVKYHAVRVRKIEDCNFVWYFSYDNVGQFMKRGTLGYVSTVN